MRDEIERELGLKALNFYGLSEMCGPGVAAECLVARDGLHVQEDHFIAEVHRSRGGSPVPDGTEGELVLTTLTKEAMPLIRYRTGDLVTASTRAVPLRPQHDAADRADRPPRRHDRRSAASTCTRRRSSS